MVTRFRQINQTTKKMRSSLSSFWTAAASLLLLTLSFTACEGASNSDTFNYDSTKGNNYAPPDWKKITCPDINKCVGWPDKFQSSQGWSINSKNHCLWCPKGNNRCGIHHNSPINVDRKCAVQGEKIYNICIDTHWMAYSDSSCKFDELRNMNGFTIERHGLKITQPVEEDDNGGKIRKLKCRGGRYAQIDFPKGYSDNWFLSHIDIHTPSEHYQNDKRYDAELQMFHFYSVSGEQAGVDNEMGTLSVFMQAYGDKDWPILNRIICAWRETEEKVRKECGLPSVSSSYDGCTNFRRRARKLLRNETMMIDDDDSAVFDEYKPAVSAYDIMMENDLHMDTLKNSSYEPILIDIDEDANPSLDLDETNWDEFIAESRREEDRFHSEGRKLANYDEINFHNYFAMKDVRTEYYFRYSGTQTVPPCYGEYVKGDKNRRQTNAWRVMKDPKEISKRQLTEMHRLILERIAPKNSPINSCKADTAAKKESGGRANVARPLQEFQKTHYMVFCECPNWSSKFKEDKDWCKNNPNQKDRLFKTPYNFKTNGF